MSTRQVSAPARDAAARRDEKRTRREAQLETRRRIEMAQRRRQRLIWGGGIGLGVIALAALVWWLVRPSASGVQSFVDLGGTHIQHGQAHPAYNSKPPTSGWHFADQVATWGVSSQPIPDELIVHGLEHAGVGVFYDCPDGCPDVVDVLQRIVGEYRSKVFMAPYPGMGHKVATAAWTHLRYFDQLDEAGVRDFVREYRNKYNPEAIPD